MLLESPGWSAEEKLAYSSSIVPSHFSPIPEITSNVSSFSLQLHGKPTDKPRFPFFGLPVIVLAVAFRPVRIIK